MNILRQTSTFHRHILILVIAMAASSCTTPLKELTYLYDIETGRPYPKGPDPEAYQVRPNDHLYINVIGEDPASTAFLNITGSSGGGMGGQNLELVTFIVDEEGNITYPRFGKIHVAGTTVDDIREFIQDKVDQYVEGASVFVKLVNRSITVLGEVRAPGQLEMNKNQLSIFEAIGLAGDITDFGDRQDVKIIRETPAGKEVVSVDLTDPNLVSSPYYYILPHDIVYVEPSSKVYGQKTMGFGSGISLVFSVVSTALLLVNYFK